MKKQTFFTIFICCQLALLWQMMFNNLQAASTDPMLLGQWPGYLRMSPVNMALSGNYIYTTSSDALLVYDITDPTHPQVVGSCRPNRSSLGAIAVSSGNYAYVTGDTMIRIFDVRDPRHPNEITQYGTQKTTYGISISDNYAYVSSINSIEIFDIRDPIKIQRVNQIQNRTGTLSFSGNYAYGLGSYDQMYVLNVINPVQLEVLAIWNIPGIPSNSAECFVASGSYLYVRYSDGFLVVDIENPAKPKLMGPGISLTRFNRGLAVEGHYAYVNSDDDFVVIDISAPEAPVVAGTCRIGDGDLSTKPLGIVIRGHYAYVLDDGLVVLDISNPAEPRVVGMARHGSTRKLDFDQSYIYATDKGELQIIDVSDSFNPRSIGSFAAQGEIIAMVLKNPYVYLSNRQGNLQIVDITNPTAPKLVGEYSEIRCQSGMQVSGNYVYVAATDGLCVIDVSDPAHPEWVGGLYKGGTPVGVKNSILYSITSANTLNTIDIQDPLNTKILSSIILDFTFADEIAIADHYAYVPGIDKLWIVDIRDPLKMQIAGSYNGPGTLAGHFGPYAVTIEGNQAFVAELGLLILDITDPTKPNRIAGKDFKVDDVIFKVNIQGNRAYLAAGRGGLLVCTLYPQAPRILEQSIRTDAAGRHLVFQGQAGQTLKIQRSPEFKNWTTWQTVIATGQEQEVVDNIPLTASIQFYRIIAP